MGLSLSQKILFLILISGSVVAEARVFNFKNEFFATYFRGTAGSSNVADSAFGDSSGTGTDFDSTKVLYDFSGELGFLFSIEEMVNFRVGMEFIQPKTIKGLAGENSANTDLFELKSEILVIHPVATIEVNFMNSGTSRFFAFAGAGLADITIDNEYTMTGTGTTELGVSSHTEKMTADQITAHGGVGYEVLFVDNVTAAFELGYRYLRTSNLTYKSDVTAISNNTASKGDKVRDNDGKARSINMSAPYIGVAFRFYIPLF